MGECVVYVYVTNRLPNIHRAGCPSIGMHGGIGLEYPSTGWYFYGLDEERRAEYSAQWGVFSVRDCGNC